MSRLTNCMIICTRNRLQDITHALTSLNVQTMQPEEIIIVDSSDTPLNTQHDFVREFCITNFPASRLVYQHTRPGLPYQRNVGTALATTDLVHFIDDDVVLEPTYIERMHAAFTAYPAHLGGMGTITNIGVPCFDYIYYLRVFFLLQRDYASGTFTASGMPQHCYGTTAFKNVEVLGGCCMSYRTPVFKKHSFDEKLGRYAFMEDCDFSKRVSADGPLFFNPQACLAHFNSPANRDSLVDARALFVRNYSSIFFKNFFPENRLRIFAYVWSLCGLFIEACLLREKRYLHGYVKGLSQLIRSV